MVIFFNLINSNFHFFRQLIASSKPSTEKRGIRNFLDYLEKNYFKSHSGWYLGYEPSAPVTNNGLEAFNKTVKQHGTFRKSLAVNDFLNMLKVFIRNQSLQRHAISTTAFSLLALDIPKHLEESKLKYDF